MRLHMSVLSYCARVDEDAIHHTVLVYLKRRLRLGRMPVQLRLRDDRSLVYVEEDVP